ncbi:hypothetical protein BASA50_005564 [Batrachochytrium salamandrivorans]|uniref:Protein PBN1 n=1 Tax=Batrachochytrium salamandrivorans TaxID=1357716 RepID=A0ABQ8FCE7_9FUNG|nr:hypothetical protein BASA50_005564 [Batrachochytrium salamandrivorans]
MGFTTNGFNPATASASMLTRHGWMLTVLLSLSRSYAMTPTGTPESPVWPGLFTATSITAYAGITDIRDPGLVLQDTDRIVLETTLPMGDICNALVKLHLPKTHSIPRIEAIGYDSDASIPHSKLGLLLDGMVGILKNGPSHCLAQDRFSKMDMAKFHSAGESGMSIYRLTALSTNSTVVAEFDRFVLSQMTRLGCVSKFLPMDQLSISIAPNPSSNSQEIHILTTLTPVANRAEFLHTQGISDTSSIVMTVVGPTDRTTVQLPLVNTVSLKDVTSQVQHDQVSDECGNTTMPILFEINRMDFGPNIQVDIFGDADLEAPANAPTAFGNMALLRIHHKCMASAQTDIEIPFHLRYRQPTFTTASHENVAIYAPVAFIVKPGASDQSIHDAQHGRQHRHKTLVRSLLRRGISDPNLPLLIPVRINTPDDVSVFMIPLGHSVDYRLVYTGNLIMIFVGMLVTVWTLVRYRQASPIKLKTD